MLKNEVLKIIGIYKETLLKTKLNIRREVEI